MSTMDVDASPDWPNRWHHLRLLLERRGPFNHPSFEPSPELLSLVRTSCRVLVLGAGGLGCELLKNLALMGFAHVHVIDMDTIDVSNLNRQFLFRPSDVGRPKAVVAAEFVNRRVPGACIEAHVAKIQDKDEAFYQQFQLVVCGLDSVVARRWINGMLISMLDYDDDGNVRQSSIIPLIDGGTEGFKGNARIIFPGITACIDCTLDLFPPQINFPLCTLAHTPRLPEHCIEFVRILLWPKESPFGEDTPIDGDDPAHIAWIHERALERAAKFGIGGVTLRLTQGVVKRIIPAVASTNAIVAAICAMETFKVATSCANPLQNYLVFNQADGIYSYAYEAERNEDCLACGRKSHRPLALKASDKLQDVISLLQESAAYQMKSPGLTTTLNGKNRTLYMSSVSSIEAATRSNLKKTLSDLGLTTGTQLVVADATSPMPFVFRLTITE